MKERGKKTKGKRKNNRMKKKDEKSVNEGSNQRFLGYVFAH